MQFLQPWMLVGLLAAAVPIVLHLLNRQRAQRIRFPMLTLVSKSQEQRRPTLKLKRWLLLAARILILLLIPLAMAQPYTECGAGGATQNDRYPAAVVLILDVSASMGREQDRAMQKEALKIARRTLRGLKAWDQVRILEAGEENTWRVTRWNNDHQAALKALDDVRWEAGHSDLPAAIDAARKQLMDSDLPLQRVVVITDNDADAWASDDLDPEDIQGLGALEVLPVTVDAQALEFAVTELTWDTSSDGGHDQIDVRARIDAYGRGKATRDVRLEIDAKEQSVQQVELDGGSHTHVTFTHTFDDDDVHVVRVLVDGPGVPAAQERWMVVHLSKSVRALLVNGASSAIEREDELYYLSRALGVEIGERQHVHTRTLTPDHVDAAAMEEMDVVVLANVEALHERAVKALKSFVKNGGGLWIAPGSNVRAEQYNQQLGDLLPQRVRDVTTLSDPEDPDANLRATRFASIDYRSPLFQAFSAPGGQSIQSARVFRYLLLEPDAGSRAEVLASYADGGPAVVESSYGQGRVILWTTSVDSDWTDLPIRTAFVPLVHRTLRYLAQRGGSDAPSAEVGERLSFDLSGLKAKELILEQDEGTRLVVDVEDGYARVTPQKLGVYHATLRGEDDTTQRAQSMDFALNAPVTEGRYDAVDPARVKAWIDAAQHGVEQGDLNDASAHRNRLWPTLLLVALLLLYLESLLGVRRRVWDGIRQRFGGDGADALQRPGAS